MILKKTQDRSYKKINISKRNGKHRCIYIVNNQLKNKLKLLMPYLENRLHELDNTNVNYAFERGKNCIEGALKHVGYKYTLSMDLANFFDSVKSTHVSDLLDKDVINTCFIDDSPRQGLPTSPLIATIAFLKCDELIVKQLKKYKLRCVYTRYADDLTFSFNDKTSRGKIQFVVSKAVESCKFTINNRKTKFQNFKNGRRIITGVAVDNTGVYPTRKTMKRIRAARHQNSEKHLAGLVEWSRCRLPKEVKSRDKINVYNTQRSISDSPF